MAEPKTRREAYEPPAHRASTPRGRRDRRGQLQERWSYPGSPSMCNNGGVITNKTIGS